MTNTSKRRKKFLLYFWLLIVSGIVSIGLLFLLIATNSLGELPGFDELENPENNLASEIISEDGEILGNYSYESGSHVDFSEISPNMINALLAAEDIRFKEHSGIDGRGTLRVLFKTILQGNRSAGGGSTITQQLAKNLFGRDTTVYKNKVSKVANLALTKFKEWVTAVRLERNYTKDEIMAMYLNKVAFGNNAYGIRSAAKTYYNTSTDDLKIEEAAMLVGLINAPSRYNPRRNEERAFNKRNQVLSQMKKYNFITKSEYDSISQIPIILDFKKQDHNYGLGTYFREYIRTSIGASEPKRKHYTYESQYLEAKERWDNDPLYGWVHKHKKPNGDSYNIYTDGLKIHTTINAKMQQYAEEAVKEHLGNTIQPDLEADFKLRQLKKGYPFSEDLTNEEVEDIITLAIKRTEQYRVMRNSGISMKEIREWFNTPRKANLFSWKGPIDTVISQRDSILYYKKFLRAGFMAMEPGTGYVKAYVGGNDIRAFQFDAVTQQKRQVGSTIKPFLYTLAMEEGKSPCDKVPNVNYSFLVGDKRWSPKNSDSRKAGEMVTLQWGLATSNNNISAWIVNEYTPGAVVNMIHRMGIKSFVPAVPSIVLGTADFSVHEMVGAYGTFANKGIYTEPIFVTRIEDKSGNILDSFEPKQSEPISEETAYLMIKLLQNVAKPGGTAIRLRYKYNLHNEMGGKTGTTQNHSDGWFMGVIPKLVGGVWVGAEDRSVHFGNISQGQGANLALPIWGLFLQKVYADTDLDVNYGDVFTPPLNFNYDLECDEGTEAEQKIIEEEESLLD